MLPCFTHDPTGTTEIHLVGRAGLAPWLERHPAHAAWLEACRWRADTASHVILPATGPAPHAALAAPADGEAAWALGHLPPALPEGRYRLAGPQARSSGDDADPAPDTIMASRDAALGWALGAYPFDRYKARRRAPAQWLVQDAARPPACWRCTTSCAGAMARRCTDPPPPHEDTPWTP